MLAFVRFISYALRPLRRLKITNICQQIHQTSVKMEAWGGPGGSWGRSWRHSGSKTAQSSKNFDKVTWSTPSPGAQLGAKI